MIESDHNYFRNKIKNKKGGKNLIIDQDSHCNQQQVVLQTLKLFSWIRRAREERLAL